MEPDETIAEAAAAIREEFELFDEWRDRIEHIVELGKSLPPLAAEHKIPQHKVSGCQSQVWMIARLDPASGRLRLAADSDAFIVKGLIALLLRLYGDRTPREILDNPPAVLEEIGLARQLTPGRSNGLWSMVKRIRELATAAATAAVPV